MVESFEMNMQTPIVHGILETKREKLTKRKRKAERECEKNKQIHILENEREYVQTCS